MNIGKQDVVIRKNNKKLKKNKISQKIKEINGNKKPILNTGCPQIVNEKDIQTENFRLLSGYESLTHFCWP